MTYSTLLFFLSVFRRNLIRYSEYIYNIVDTKATFMFGKATTSKCYVSTRFNIFQPANYLLSLLNHSNPPIAQSSNKMPVLITDYLVLMHTSQHRCHCYTALRTLHHSGTAVFPQIAFIAFVWYSEWAAIIFLTILKEWSVWHRKRVFLWRTDSVFGYYS